MSPGCPADEAKGAGLLSLVTGLASTTASGLLQRARGTLPTLPGRSTGGRAGEAGGEGGLCDVDGGALAKHLAGQE